MSEELWSGEEFVSNRSVVLLIENDDKEKLSKITEFSGDDDETKFLQHFFTTPGTT